MFDIIDYSWVKALHVIAIISWMAGLLYLPRLFVYHCDAEVGSELSETLKIMEKRLFNYIMKPAAGVAWIAGLYMAFAGDWFSDGWFHLKLTIVVLLTIYNDVFLSRWLKAFAADKNLKTQKFFRIANEVPTIAMILIVIMVIVKPF